MIIKKKFEGTIKYVYKDNKFLCKEETDIVMYYASKTKGNVVEIGCNAGLTTLALSKKFPTKTIYAVDYEIATNKNQEYEKMNLWDNCKGLKNVICINEDSRFIDINKFENATMSFIDGDHTREAVTKDFENMDKLIKKGFILLHDYMPGNPYKWNNVAEVIDKLAETRDIIIYEGTAIAVIEK